MIRWMIWIISLILVGSGNGLPLPYLLVESDTSGVGRGFVGFRHQDDLPWVPFDLRPWPPGLQAKLLSRDVKSGAISLLVYYPPGWESRDPGYHRADEELFVLEGDLTVGERTLTRWSYLYVPSETIHGPRRTENGCLALQFYNRTPDFIPTEKVKVDTSNAVIYKNFYEEPWSHGLLRHRSPTPPPLLVKILRLDPQTGARTWIAGILGGHSKRPWEIHPTWEEGYLLEGESTVGECLPEGLKIGTYRPGGYFFRPAGIAHGGPHGGTETYAIWFFRAPARLEVQYFDESECPQPQRSTGKQ
jgi:hypothetical protein